MCKEDLAKRLKPKNIDKIIGQNRVKNLFKNFITSKNIPHSIFFGPPGCGKTTLSNIIANELGSDFYSLDGANFKVESLRKIINNSKNSLFKPLIFIDEIHRLSKTQQEILLIPLENREIIFIGASTDNPYFMLTDAIRSRCMLFEFEKIGKSDLINYIDLLSKKLGFKIDSDAKEFLVHLSNGDIRAMLNLIEYSLLLSNSITKEILKTLKQTPSKSGANSKDTHYDLISAMIKSIRGSEIDASLYYLARLIDSGESCEFIARRMVILASEDIGNANPNALILANSTFEAVKNIGYPEARIILSQALIYLASSPKSNSCYKAIDKALEEVRKSAPLEVPKHLKSFDNKGYLYPHEFGGYVEQKYLQKELKLYENNSIGYEKTLNEWIEKIKNNKGDG